MEGIVHYPHWKDKHAAWISMLVKMVYVVLLSSPFLSQDSWPRGLAGLMERPNGRVCISRTIQRECLCVCLWVGVERVCPLINVSLSVTWMMIMPINLAWTILLRQHMVIITILSRNLQLPLTISPKKLKTYNGREAFIKHTRSVSPIIHT